DEHDAGDGDAAHAGDWSGKGAGSAAARHSVSVSGGGAGDYGDGRVAGNSAVVCGVGVGGAADILQRDGKARGSGRHPSDFVADDSGGSYGDIGFGGSGEWDGSRDAGCEAGSD